MRFVAIAQQFTKFMNELFKYVTRISHAAGETL